MTKHEMHCTLKSNGIEMTAFILGVILNFIKKKMASGLNSFLHDLNRFFLCEWILLILKTIQKNCSWVEENEYSVCQKFDLGWTPVLCCLLKCI